MFRTLRSPRWALLMLLMVTTSCQSKRAAPTAAADHQSARPMPAVQGPVAVAIKSWSEVEQLVAAQRGKVVIVDLWATW